MGRRGGAGDRGDRDWLTESFSFATVHLGWQPSEFWTATPDEFWAAYLATEKMNKQIKALTDKGRKHGHT